MDERSAGSFGTHTFPRMTVVAGARHVNDFSSPSNTLHSSVLRMGVSRADANSGYFALNAAPSTFAASRGFLLRLEARCRKMTQVLWCEEMRTFIRHLGCVLLVPRYRLMCRKNL